jgi:hypothetical protein
MLLLPPSDCVPRAGTRAPHDHELAYRCCGWPLLEAHSSSLCHSHGRAPPPSDLTSIGGRCMNSGRRHNVVASASPPVTEGASMALQDIRRHWLDQSVRPSLPKPIAGELYCPRIVLVLEWRREWIAATLPTAEHFGSTHASQNRVDRSLAKARKVACRDCRRRIHVHPRGVSIKSKRERAQPRRCDTREQDGSQFRGRYNSHVCDREAPS